MRYARQFCAEWDPVPARQMILPTTTTTVEEQAALAGLNNLMEQGDRAIMDFIEQERGRVLKKPLVVHKSASARDYGEMLTSANRNGNGNGAVPLSHSHWTNAIKRDLQQIHEEAERIRRELSDTASRPRSPLEVLNEFVRMLMAPPFEMSLEQIRTEPLIRRAEQLLLFQFQAPTPVEPSAPFSM